MKIIKKHHTKENKERYACALHDDMDKINNFCRNISISLESGRIDSGFLDDDDDDNDNGDDGNSGDFRQICQFRQPVSFKLFTFYFRCLILYFSPEKTIII